MDIGNIVLEHEIDGSRFANALMGEDDIGALIRCHYEAERAVNHILNRLSGGRASGIEGWQNFGQKLEVCRALGVGENLLAPLKSLNKHRNALAHRGRERIEEQEVLDLFRQVAAVYPRYGDDFRMTFTGKHEFDKIYAECSAKEQYVISVIVAVTLLAAVPQIPTA